MNARTCDILHSIVQSYIETGEPVASRTISESHSAHLSPASIRNVMAELSEGGFLAQPHTSAGRVPTEKAFRSYVESLSSARVLASELERLRTQLARMRSLEERVEHSSHLLTGMTRGFCIAAAIPASRQFLDQIELVPMTSRRVLMIVVTKDQIVRNRVVTIDEELSSTQLRDLSNYINRNFSGWTLAHVRAEVQRRLAEERAACDAILKTLTVFYAKGLLDVEPEAEVHVEGASNLVGVQLHLTEDRMRELLRALEEKTRILQLLDRFLEQPAGEVAVHVGLGDAHPSMSELSLIGVSVSLGGGLSAKIAVLGPMRMNYPKAISAVRHMGEAFQSLPS